MQAALENLPKNSINRLVGEIEWAACLRLSSHKDMLQIDSNTLERDEIHDYSLSILEDVRNRIAGVVFYNKVWLALCLETFYNIGMSNNERSFYELATY